MISDLNSNLNKLSILTEEIDISTYKSFIKTLSTIDELLEWLDVNTEVGFETKDGQRYMGNIFDNEENFKAFQKSYTISEPFDYFTSGLGLSFDQVWFLGDVFMNAKILDKGNEVEKPFAILIYDRINYNIFDAVLGYITIDKSYNFFETSGDFKGLHGDIKESNNLLLDKVIQIYAKKYNVSTGALIAYIYPIKVLKPGTSSNHLLDTLGIHLTFPKSNLAK